MSDELMPVIFIGHGSPMNAIEDNFFTNEWQRMAHLLPRPETILCISAHWYTHDTRILAVEKPRTIHDFYGFPEELYIQQYPAKGNIPLAKEISDLVRAELDTNWGLDHGTWSILKRMYPDADIPTIQLSINYKEAPSYHYELMRKLKDLRNEGVLIVGSGNLVHNLRAIAWDMPEGAYDWNQEFASLIDVALKKHDHSSVVGYEKLGPISKQAHPTPDHFYPLLYALGATDSNDRIQSFAEGYVFGSIAMTSYIFGL